MKGMIVFGWCCKKGYGCLGSKLSKIRIFFPFSFLPLLLNSRTPWQLLLFPVCVCHGWCVCCYCWLGGAPFSLVFFSRCRIFSFFSFLCFASFIALSLSLSLSLSYPCPQRGDGQKTRLKSDWAIEQPCIWTCHILSSSLSIALALLPRVANTHTRTHTPHHPPIWSTLSRSCFHVFTACCSRSPFWWLVSAFNVSLSESRLFCWSLRSDGDYSDTPCPYTFWIALRVFRLLILCICD